MSQEQNHPLYDIDRDHLDSLLAKDVPADEDVINLSRLLIRYNGFSGAFDLKEDMNKILKLWGLTKDTLNSKARLIWEKGYRPGENATDGIGSGFDTSDNSTN